MGIGRLRQRITIQTSSSARNDTGEVIKTWNDGDAVWADIQPGAGRERLAADQIIAEQTHSIRTRFHEDLTPSNRISFESRIFRIIGVQNLRELDSMLDIAAQEVL